MNLIQNHRDRRGGLITWAQPFAAKKWPFRSLPGAPCGDLANDPIERPLDATRSTACRDGKSGYGFALAARSARGVDEPSAQEGVGNAGCPLHPRSRVHLVVVERTRVTTSTPESPGVPARNGFNGFLRALPGERALLPPSLSGYVLSKPGRADLTPRT